jgi:hypothetical protein
MGDGTNRDEIHASLRDGAHGFQVHAAAGFGLRAARDERHCFSQLRRSHVVEQHDVRAGGNGLLHLFERVGFDFDFQFGKPRAGPGHRSGDGVRPGITQRGKMIVFDENHVEKTKPMIATATTGHGIFFKLPPARRGFARVENLRASAAHRLDELRRERGYAGQTLDIIQCNTFGTQHPARRTTDFQ